VEVAHPDITLQYGAKILKIADYMVSGSKFINTNTNTTIDLVRRLQIERRRITMSGTLKNDKTGTVCE